MIVLPELQSVIYMHLNGNIGATFEYFPKPDQTYPFVSCNFPIMSDLGVKCGDTGGVTVVFDVWSNLNQYSDLFTISENLRKRMLTLPGFQVNFESAEIVDNITDEIKHLVINYSIV